MTHRIRGVPRSAFMLCDSEGIVPDAVPAAPGEVGQDAVALFGDADAAYISAQHVVCDCYDARDDRNGELR
ncbi:MAG TPA: hypothetical protein VJQ77_02595 [Novosphingobium sp.]|nr:hypothetical protein [Novosphingobium sp.]